jgi:DNA-binding transcriptional ArsR family regulator
MSPTSSRRQQQKRRATLRPHPARDQIVQLMRSYGQPISPTRLARITGMTLGSVAYHVRTLVSAGVIELADEGRVRGAVEHFYALARNDEDTQLGDPVRDLLGLCGALTVASDDGGYPRPAALDAKSRQELVEILKELRPRVRDIVENSTARAQTAS